MKKNIIRVLVCVMIGMISCATACTDHASKTQKEPLTFIEENDSDSFLRVSKFEFENHHYIKYHKSSGKYSWGGVVHDPNCSTCLKRYNYAAQ